MEVDFQSHKDEIKKEYDERLETVLEAIGQEAEGNAKKEITEMIYDTPESPNYKRTGRLRNDITHEVHKSEGAVYIGNSVKYAILVHNGTRRMKARRYLKNAVIKYKDEYKAIAEKLLKGS